MSQKFTKWRCNPYHCSRVWAMDRLQTANVTSSEERPPKTTYSTSCVIPQTFHLNKWAWKTLNLGPMWLINFAAEHPPCKKAGLYKPRPQSQTCLRTRSHWPKFPGLVPLTHRAAELSSIQQKQHELQLNFVWFFPHQTNSSSTKKNSRIFLNELGSGNFIYSDDLPWQISAL